MSTLGVIVIVVAVLLLLAGAAFVLTIHRRADQLRERFGPEYDRTIATSQDRREAERELSARVGSPDSERVAAVAPDRAERRT